MDIGAKIASHVAQKFQMSLCYSKKIEERSSNCLVSALKGSNVSFKNCPNIAYESSEGRVKYLLGQYQSCDESDVRNVVDILFYTETDDDEEPEKEEVEDYADNEEFNDLDDGEIVSETIFNTERVKDTLCSEEVLGNIPRQMSEVLL